MTESHDVYDIVIVGAGPAGLTASIYASRYRLSNVVIGKLLGGEMALAHIVENYPGFSSIPGPDLAQKIADQVKHLGAEIIFSGVNRTLYDKETQVFTIETDGGANYHGRALIIACGSERKKLNIPGENDYLGRGVSYCTNCDGPFFRDKIVAVIGGGDSAVTGALHLTQFAKKIYLIYRRKKEDMRAEPIWVEKLIGEKKVECIFENNIVEVLGDGNKVGRVKLANPHNGDNVLSLDGVFIEIGSVPGSALLKPLGVACDSDGFIVVNDDMSTNVDWIYAAGDITVKSKNLQQIVIAEAQGATAAASIFKRSKKKNMSSQWGKAV